MSEAVRKLKDRAAQYVAKGKLPAALEDYRKVLVATPGDIQVRQKVAELLARLGKKAEAISAYEGVVQSYASSGQFFKATALCKVILQLDPAHMRTQESLADLYSKRKEAPGAARPVTAPPPRPAAPIDSSALLLPKPNTALPGPEPIDIPIEVAEDEEIVIGEEISIEITPEPAPVPPSELPVIPLFSDLSREDFIAVLQGAVEAKAFNAGETIVREGDKGDAMYAIVQGSVGVVRGVDGQAPRTVATMNEGDLFGEMALLSESPRLATVVAAVDTVVLEFARKSLDALAKKHPGIWDAIQRFYRDRLLANLLRSSPLLRPLSEQQKVVVTNEFQSETFDAGDLILKQGELGDGFYLLLRGRCAVFHTNNDGKEVPYPEMKEGDVFGEISVLLGLPVSASVRATSQVVVLWLPAEKVKKLLLSQPVIAPMLTRLATERLQRTAQLMTSLEAAAADLRV
ncbi:MAG: cyclic nucleotide-binding domain-containing protein [Myxococcaceae bacterium]